MRGWTLVWQDKETHESAGVLLVAIISLIFLIYFTESWLEVKIIGLAVSLFFLLRSWLEDRTTVSVFEEGIVFRPPKLLFPAIESEIVRASPETIALKWDDIGQVFVSREKGFKKMSVETRDGKRIERVVEDAEGLRAALKQFYYGCTDVVNALGRL